MFSWYYIEGILIQSCYTLLIVLGLSILTGYTGMFSFGHAGFVCIGAYVSILCTMAFGLPYWLSLIIAGLAAMLLGAGLGKITLNLKGDYFCIATLGVGEAIRLIFNNLQLTINVGGKDFLLDGAKGVASIPLKTTLFGDWNALSNGDVGTFLSTLFSSALFIVIIFLTATALLMNSKHGRSMLAVREDELAAQMSGINTFRSKMLAMCMSALYAGIAGGMMAHYFGYLQPKMFLMTKSTEYTIMVIFGGMGSITGSVLGTVLLCALPELLRAVGDWRLVMYGLAVIVIMIVRPKGLMGGKELPVGRICRAVGRVFTKKKKDLPPPDGGSVGEDHARALERHQALRRPDRRGRRFLQDQKRRDLRAHRPQRRGQDHHLQPHHGRLRAHRGPRHFRRYSRRAGRRHHQGRYARNGCQALP